MNRERFERHLDRFRFEKDVRDRYEQVFDNLLRCRNIADDIAENKAKKLQFMAFVVNNKVLLTVKDVQKAKTPMFVHFPVAVSDNLFATNSLKGACIPRNRLRLLDFVSVYSPADEYERPALSLLDIARQLPDEYAENTKAVCLLLEDGYQQNGYNLVLMQYEYRVMLLG